MLDQAAWCQKQTNLQTHSAGRLHKTSTPAARREKHCGIHGLSLASCQQRTRRRSGSAPFPKFEVGPPECWDRAHWGRPGELSTSNCPAALPCVHPLALRRKSHNTRKSWMSEAPLDLRGSRWIARKTKASIDRLRTVNIQEAISNAKAFSHSWLKLFRVGAVFEQIGSCTQRKNSLSGKWFYKTLRMSTNCIIFCKSS